MEIHRVAVVSDIHANIHALTVFMDYLNARQEIQTVLNLGDFLQYGPNPVEVYDIVMNDKRFINILGNNEMDLFESIDEDNEERLEHITWTKNALGEERLNRLREVSKSMDIDLYGTKLMLVHTVTSQLVDMNKLTQCQYVLMGHTHLQSFGSYWNEKKIMNPGSIGYTPNGFVNFSVIEIGGGMFNFVFKNMKYDTSKLKEDLLKKSVPEAEKIIKYIMQGED